MTTTNKTIAKTTKKTNAASEAKAPRKAKPTVDELNGRALHTDRLWNMVDVAVFLRVSYRYAEDLVRDPAMPQPRLVLRSGERLWSPARWQQWMDDPDTFYVDGDIDQSPDAVNAGITEMGAL